MESQIPTFWIIDDDPNVNEMLSTRFPEYNFKWLDNKLSLKNAISKQNICDGIILDYKLSHNQTGTDLIPLIRTGYPDVPILLLTAYGSKEVILQGLRAQVDSYQDKPINFSEMERTLLFLLNKRYGQRYQEATYNQHIKTIKSLLKEPTKQPPPSLKDISDKNKFNYKYMSRKFKQETGFTFSQLQVSHIVNTAKRLLTTTSLSIKQISEMLGYKHSTAFMRVFKNQTGLTAKQYRKITLVKPNTEEHKINT